MVSWLAAVVVIYMCLLDVGTTVAGTLELAHTAFLGTISCTLASGLVVQILYGRKLSKCQVISAKVVAASVGQAQCRGSRQLTVMCAVLTVSHTSVVYHTSARVVSVLANSLHCRSSVPFLAM